MSVPDDDLDRRLRALPTPPLNAAHADRVRAAARQAFAGTGPGVGSWRTLLATWRRAGVPAVLVAAGILYAFVAAHEMRRIYRRPPPVPAAVHAAIPAHARSLPLL